MFTLDGHWPPLMLMSCRVSCLSSAKLAHMAASSDWARAVLLSPDSERIFMKSLSAEKEHIKTVLATAEKSCAFSEEVDVAEAASTSICGAFLHLSALTSARYHRARGNVIFLSVVTSSSQAFSLSPGKCLIYILFRPNMACLCRCLLNSQFSEFCEQVALPAFLCTVSLILSD